MSLGNRVVMMLLRSPVHGVLSGAVGILRYRGQSSGREYATPTQYAVYGDGLLVLAGRADTKTWWRNFRTDHELDYCVRRQWLPMSGRAVVGADDPDGIAPLLDAYLARFPKAGRSLGDDADARRRAVIVWCRPRADTSSAG